MLTWMHRRLHGEAGLGLVETLAAFFLISFGLLSMATVAQASLASLQTARERQTATDIASTVLERARLVAYDELANLTGDTAVPWATYDPDGTGCLGTETVQRTPVGAVTGVPFQEGPDTPTVAQRSVRTIVTVPTRLQCGASPATVTARRVTVVVRWVNVAGTEFSVRQTSLIAPSDRGAPIPRFDITPRDYFVGRPRGPIDLSHMLTNQGRQDGYQIVQPPLPPFVTLTVTAGGTPLTWVPQGPEIVANTPAVPSGSTLPIEFRWNVPDPETSFVRTITVRSVTDPAIAIDLSHDITTTSDLVLYLHDPFPPDGVEKDHARDVGTVDWYPMDELRPVPAQLYNVDTNFNGLPALQLPKAIDLSLPPDLLDLNDYGSPVHGRWRFQFDPPSGWDIGPGTARLYLWTASTSALDPPIDPLLEIPLPPVPATVAVRWRLSHTFTGPMGPEQTIIAQSPTELLNIADYYLHLAAGWVGRTYDISIPSTIHFAQNDYIELQLVCDVVVSTEDCHVAYDARNPGAVDPFPYEARLELPTP